LKFSEVVETNEKWVELTNEEKNMLDNFVATLESTMFTDDGKLDISSFGSAVKDVFDKFSNDLKNIVLTIVTKEKFDLFEKSLEYENLKKGWFLESWVFSIGKVEKMRLVCEELAIILQKLIWKEKDSSVKLQLQDKFDDLRAELNLLNNIFYLKPAELSIGMDRIPKNIWQQLLWSATISNWRNVMHWLDTLYSCVNDKYIQIKIGWTVTQIYGQFPDTAIFMQNDEDSTWFQTKFTTKKWKVWIKLWMTTWQNKDQYSEDGEKLLDKKWEVIKERDPSVLLAIWKFLQLTDKFSVFGWWYAKFSDKMKQKDLYNMFVKLQYKKSFEKADVRAALQAIWALKDPAVMLLLEVSLHPTSRLSIKVSSTLDQKVISGWKINVGISAYVKYAFDNWIGLFSAIKNTDVVDGGMSIGGESGTAVVWLTWGKFFAQVDPITGDTTAWYAANLNGSSNNVVSQRKIVSKAEEGLEDFDIVHTFTNTPSGVLFYDKYGLPVQSPLKKDWDGYVVNEKSRNTDLSYLEKWRYVPYNPNLEYPVGIPVITVDDSKYILKKSN